MNAVQQDAATTVSQGLFKGIAVVIDDGIGKVYEHGPDGIDEILQAIKRAGGYTVELDTLPQGDQALESLSNAAFFIMDWNLHGSALEGNKVDRDLETMGLNLGGLGDHYEQDNVKFLRALRSRRHAPVFIFTNESVEHVKSVLTDGGLMGHDTGSHILVRNKREVGDKLFEVLDTWLKDTPSALVLKQWEQNHVRAVNALFNEFHDRNTYWPVIFWESYKDDGVAPQPELGELITRLVAARMTPLDVDLNGMAQQADEHFGIHSANYRPALHAVLQSERLLPAGVLDPQAFAPGDLFFDPNNGHPRYMLNIRPACDCVQREGISDEKMYLLKGRVIGEDELKDLADHTNGNLREKDVEAIVFALHEGKTISFNFRMLTIKDFSKYMKEATRIGRVLPPFVTRISQRYAAYSHRPGLPRIPAALMPAKPAEQQGALVTATSCDCGDSSANDSSLVQPRA